MYNSKAWTICVKTAFDGAIKVSEEVKGEDNITIRLAISNLFKCMIP
jgi:hypothetical protein